MSSSGGSNWQSSGMSQTDFMRKDECILLDEDDKIIGHGSKLDAHTFSEKQARGILHRAFSVFLFNSEGKLLLQKRAASKITFPNVWTNTCCSHPLYGYTPNEVDGPEAVANGTVMGAKAAAVRKLEHELGIKAKDVPIASFKFLTRLHYWAADVVTHGATAPWGEHEIDYILFIQVPTLTIPTELNPEEVDDIKYVSYDELRRMMKPASGLLWSPWFRIIVEKFLVHWWKDLHATMTSDRFVDVKTIYRFDPTPEHMGGAGKAGKWLGSEAKLDLVPASASASTSSDNSSSSNSKNAALKQGGYGKVKVHGHSTWNQISHVDEVFAALWMKYCEAMPNKIDRSKASTKFCDDILVKVSRSFAAVIQQLPKDLCKDIMVFYLVLRALDTVEDDMSAFVGREKDKLRHLTAFHTYLTEDGWCMQGVGEADERVLLEQFHNVVVEFKSLPRPSQEVIANITKRMGAGMAEFVEKDLGEGTVTKADYNLYCHYVAGMIGEGLSQLFTSTGYEGPEVAAVAQTTANTMGVFLQKTNIIRDYLEDYTDGRTFYPQEVWKKYSTTGELGEFAKPEARERAVWLLNDLVTDALTCIPECLEYMSLLQTEETFRFCAIPQVMAIATLSELYGNPNVFTGVVKIRKGMAAKLILEAKGMDALHKTFYEFAVSIMSRVQDNDPNAEATKAVCRRVIGLTSERAWSCIGEKYAARASYVAPVVLTMGLSRLASRVNFSAMRCPMDIFSSATLQQLTNRRDLVTSALCAVSAGFLLCYTYSCCVGGSGKGGRKALKKGDSRS